MSKTLATPLWAQPSKPGCARFTLHGHKPFFRGALMKKVYCILFAITFATAADYSPFGHPAYLTSSFGENRGTRYHAGIDYSTEMEEGWPVLAPEAGTIEEVRVSPFAYGKVLFFKGKSGRLWVFAHRGI
jgi:murein DD-endopeptidase MepM/ murein hydrolase activator NlpD